ncbi:kelch domain-containing protein 8B [Denticeps clupeoides]|uniref:Kelch domain-containing protein 8B n=1 Tax=Denticeps clupeoides TaxID=299321 RepID=A0AAY4EHA2_9TELE|nr:kelch domain-containing protein 8B [Denticeps clupeoides]XP_028850147.1 kelch domain-containing protein 8B [Denticeps clupeoides]
MPVPEMALTPVKSLHWEVYPPMSARRVYCTPVLQPGLLYVLGGCSENGMPLDSAEVLDLETQQWSALPPLPTARAGASAVALGNRVLVMGGMDAQQSPLASVEVYNPDEGKWERKNDLEQASMGITSVEKDGTVYALGGMGADTTPQALVRIYEPTKDQWLPLTSMPTPRYGAGSFLRGNKIYVLGGRQGKLPVTAFEAFDLETKSWVRFPCIPSRRAFSSCAATERSFFSLGGLQQPGPHNFYARPHFVSTMEKYDLDQGVWLKPTRSSRMREKRADFVAGCLGGRVIAAGGLGNEPSPLASVECYNPLKRRWEYMPPLPTPRCSCASVQTLNMLFLIGGVSQGPSDAVEALCLRESV